MNENTIIIIFSTIITVVFGPVIVAKLSKKKTDAEIHNINIAGQLDVGNFGMQYARQMQADKEELRAEFTAQIATLKADHAQELLFLRTEFLRITNAKDDQIVSLQARVRSLEEEVAKYKNNTSDTIDTATTAIHQAVDVAAEQIKHDTQ